MKGKKKPASGTVAEKRPSAAQNVTSITKTRLIDLPVRSGQRIYAQTVI
jgi:septum site-determining protein MinC